MCKLLKSAVITAIFSLTLFSSTALSFANHLPAPNGHVNDFAGVLTSEQKTTLERDLANYKSQTGNEIAVVLVSNLDGGDIDDFTVRAFEEWKIGNAGKDNGLLLLAAIEDRKIRIEPGYGLEPYLTDSEAGSIIRDIIAPEFKKGDYFTGIVRATESIKIQLSTDPVKEAPNDKKTPPWVKILVEIGLPLLFVAALYLFAYMSRTKSIWLGGIVGGGIGAVVGIIAASVIIALIALVILGILGTVLDYILSTVYQKRKTEGKPTDWWHSGGGFFAGGGGGGGFGGFGGGRSRGGGAHGGWEK